jgi:DNA (cytosine-5)-methyltransferase 1
LAEAGRAPRVIVFENVTGLLTSRGGADFGAAATAFAEGGYRLGAVVMDAARFVPQSRPRLFVVAQRADAPAPEGLSGEAPAPDWTPPALSAAVAALPPAARAAWVWWRLPPAPGSNRRLEDMLERDDATAWRSDAQTARLIELMAPPHRARVTAAQAEGRRRVATVYRRTRPDGAGGRAQRAEARFDGVAGCLRTPAGGSSRQTILVVEGASVRSRLLTPREGARLMGLPDSYLLPASASAALKLVGDGVAVPVAAHLACWLLAPLARAG